MLGIALWYSGSTRVWTLNWWTLSTLQPCPPEVLSWYFWALLSVFNFWSVLLLFCCQLSCSPAVDLSFIASHRFLPCRSVSVPKLLPAHRHRQGLFGVCLVWCCHKCGRKSHIRECSSPHYVSVHPRILQGWTQWYFVPLGKLPEKLGGSAESLIPGFQSTQGDAFATSSFSAGTGKCNTCLRHEDHCCFHLIDSSSIWRTQFLVVSHYFPSFSSCPAKRHLRTTKNHFEFRCWSAVVNIQDLLSPFSVCLM